MSLSEEILKKWENLDAREVVDELIEKANILTDLQGRPQGSIDGVFVYDLETKKLVVVKESYNTFTPSFIYLYRLTAYDKANVHEDDIYFDFIEKVPEKIQNLKEEE